jgi:hypothetical protein
MLQLLQWCASLRFAAVPLAIALPFLPFVF